MSKNTYYIFFSKLSNPLRIKIISCLEKRPMSVTMLCKNLNIEQSKLSHALKELRACNIINFEQKGKKRIYSLNKTIIPILKLINLHSKKYCKICCENCKKNK